MSVHQKRVTITAVDLSKVTNDSVIVITCEDEFPTGAEMEGIRKNVFFDFNRRGINPLDLRIICLKKGQTLTVEQLPKQPAPEAQKEKIE